MQRTHWNALSNYCSGISLLTNILIASSFYIQSNLAYSGENCKTPTGAPGQCVIYKDCAYIVELQEKYAANTSIPQDVRTYLLNARCNTSNDTRYHICCELKPADEHEEIIFTNAKEDFVAKLNKSTMQLLQKFQCGITNTNRISFGENARLAEYPWMALLRYDNPSQPFQCGGSLVSNRYVVTAAHCMAGIVNNLIGVRLGEHDIDNVEDCIQRLKEKICYTAEDFGIEKIIPHPNYNKHKYINDIGLIRIDRDVEFKGNIAPICLPITNQAAQLTKYPDNYVLAGWGKTETGVPSKILQKTSLLPKPRSYCQELFKIVKIENEHICAGGEERRDSCRGDSGGPLFTSTLFNYTSRFVLYGVVSFGVVRCGDEKTYPGVYTNVVHFMPWLADNIYI